MPTIGGRFYSAFGNYSTYQSLQIERARNAAANQQAESDLSTLTSAIGDVSVQLSQGLADLAAKQALARLNASIGSQQETPSTAAPGAAPADDPVDPATAVDEVINGIDELVASTDQETEGGVGDVTALVGQIIDGTADLLTPADSDPADGGDLFAAIDSIINSFVPPLPPSVDITA